MVRERQRQDENMWFETPHVPRLIYLLFNGRLPTDKLIKLPLPQHELLGPH